MRVIVATLITAAAAAAYTTTRSGAAAAVPAAQASNVSVRHHGGQTLVTWREASPLVTDAETPLGRIVDLRKGAPYARTRYRIYRSPRPIATLAGATLVGEAPPLTGWNTDFYGIYGDANKPALRYVVDAGSAPVGPDVGVFAFNTPAEGDAYYAVTVAFDGVENKTIGGGNATEAPLHEVVGPGEPVLQRTVKPASFLYVENPTLTYYVRWEVPPNSSVAGRPFDYLVGQPAVRDKIAPAGLHLHAWGASLEGGYGWWYNADRGAVLIASNEIPYDWWTGYPDKQWTGVPLATKSDWQNTVVHPYTQRRLLSFLDWAAVKYHLDLKRSFTGGDSMGGSGSLMLAIRHGDRVAWAVSWVGVHVPALSPTFMSSYAGVYGDPAWGVKFEDGTPVWDYFDDVKYLRAHVERDTGFLTFSNGKNDGGIGWKQAVDFYRALQDTRRPHLFVWGQGGHGERAWMPAAGGERIMPIDIRVDQTLPAFTHSSLDDNPGNGDERDGAPAGQVNRYLAWETGSIVDAPDQWAMTVSVIPESPRDDATVDVTPRRVQKFKVAPGTRVAWTNTPKRRGAPQSGQAVVDANGLITLERVAVSKGGNRLKITVAHEPSH